MLQYSLSEVKKTTKLLETQDGSGKNNDHKSSTNGIADEDSCDNARM